MTMAVLASQTPIKWVCYKKKRKFKLKIQMI